MMERTLDVDGTTVPHLDVIAWCGGIGTCLLPVAVVPAGRTRTGLPVGVQVIGPWLGDLGLLQIAAALDEIGDGFVAPPGFDAGGPHA